MKKSKISALALLSALAFAACGSDPIPPQVAAEAAYIAPPIPRLDPAFQTFAFDAEKGDLIKLANGGSLKFQPNALLDAEGKPVKGKVNIKYREFHNAVDIMLSGIPMFYSEGSQKGHFQTAGMFELRAELDGKPLKLDPKKPTLVRMASYEMGDDYDFFSLVEENRAGWKKLGHSKPEINVEKKKKIDKIKSKLKNVTQLDKNHFVFSFDGVLDATFDNNYSDISEKGASVSKSKAQKYGIDQLDMPGHTRFDHKGARYASSLVLWKNLGGKKFPDWMRDQKKVYGHDLVPTGKSGVFQLIATNIDKTTTFKTEIEFVMPLKSLFAYSPEHWANNYATAMKEVESEMERMKREVDAFRSFEVAGMGIFNYDKILNEADAIVTEAKFEKDASVTEASYSLNTIFYFVDDKTLIKMPQADWKQVALLPSMRSARFVCIYPNDGIGIFTSEQYQKLDFAGLKKQEKPLITIPMSKQIDRLASAEDLAKALGI